MLITGIAHPPARLLEKTQLPSLDLIYLAVKALKDYQATGLITSLNIGWEMALTEAALELKLPVTVLMPYPGREVLWHEPARKHYTSLLSKSQQVSCYSDLHSEVAYNVCLHDRILKSDLVLALWEHSFEGETFYAVDYALKNQKTVANLWEEWRRLARLRHSELPTLAYRKSGGAQIFENPNIQKRQKNSPV